MRVHVIQPTEGFWQCICKRKGCTHAGSYPIADGTQRCEHQASYRYSSDRYGVPVFKEWCEQCAKAVGLPTS